MATTTDAVLQARRILQDYDIDRHTDADLLKYVNSARRALQDALPHVYSVEELVTLVAGSRQTLPADCGVFFELTRNEGGQPITIAEREFLDTFTPGWRSKTAGLTRHYCYDERDRFKVDVYPPAVAGNKVYASFSRIPADLADGANLSAHENLMFDPLVDYAVGRVLLEDGESPVNQQRAIVHFQAFAARTGSNLGQVLANSPNTFNQGGTPPRIQAQE